MLTPAPERNGQKPPALLGTTLAAAASIWNDALSSCQAPRLLANLEVLAAPSVRDDLVNTVTLHQFKWCPISSIQREDCYPSDLQGRTHLYPTLQPGTPRDGELRGIDIELNDVDFHWSAQGEVGDTLSLQTLLVHELGHVLGLDHPCGPNTEWSQKKKPLVPCDPSATAQVMRADIASVTKGEKVAPSKSEIAAVCGLYRSSNGPSP
ncbi:MAG: matrixin family metalloprotease [Pseudomonadota bacterium]